eukprot:s827_g13.t1
MPRKDVADFVVATRMGGANLLGVLHSLGYTRGLLEALHFPEQRRIESMLRFALLGDPPDGASGHLKQPLALRLTAAQEAWVTWRVRMLGGHIRLLSPVARALIHWTRAEFAPPLWWLAAVPALLLAQQLLATMEPSRYTCNAASNAASGCWPLALQWQLLGSCCALERDVVALGTEVRVQERAGRWQNAVELLGEAEKFGVKMEIITCNTVLSSCQSKAEWQKCFDLVRLMLALSVTSGLEQDVVPNSFTYCALFSACEKAADAGAWRMALEGLQLLPCRRLMPETILGNAVLSACGKAGKWISATALLGDCDDCSWKKNDVSVNAVLGGFGSEACVGLWRRGQVLFQSMRAEGLKCNLISCNSLMTIFEKNREWRHAQNILATGLSCFGVTEDAVTLNAMLSAYEKGYQWRCAQWQLACVVKSNPKMVSVVTLSACISAYGVAAAWERAVHLYKNLVDFGIQPNSVTCGAALGACERGRSWSLALGLAEASTSLGLGPVELNAALTACSYSHVTDRALSFAQQMVAKHRLQVDVVTCNTILSLCSHEGLWLQSIQLLQGGSMGSMALDGWDGLDGLDFRNLQPDILSFGAALASCAVAGRPFEAMDLLTDAAASRIILDTVAVTNAVSACHRRHLWQQVLYLTSGMSGTASDAALLQVSLDSADIAGCQFACVEFLDALASEGTEAMGVLIEMDQKSRCKAVGTYKTPVFGGWARTCDAPSSFKTGASNVFASAVAVTSGGVSEPLGLVLKRSSDLGLHTEVLQSREDPTTWILCDYHRDVPKGPGADLPMTLQPLKSEVFQRAFPSPEATASGRWLNGDDFVGPMEDALYYAVFFDILPQHVEAFAHGLTEEAEAVERLEPKTARFHLWQNTTDASRWVVLEAFREAAGREEHASMPHYLMIRSQLEEWQRSPDPCRALPCDACGAVGSVLPSGHKPQMERPELGLTWSCQKCCREASGDALHSAAEVQLTQRVLLELKPARGVPKATAEELVALAADARSRLGDHHWTSAGAALVLHFRCRAEGGLLTPFAVACGLRFLGWLVDRKLAMPPAGIVRTPIAMALDCIAWLCATPKALTNSRALEHRQDAPQDAAIHMTNYYYCFRHILAARKRPRWATGQRALSFR